jgi:hypothetical protein
VALYNEAARARGGDPEIGPKLPSMFRRLGLVGPQLRVVHPVFMDGEAKRIHQLTMENITDAVIAAGLAEAERIQSLAEQMEQFAADPETIVSFPRIYQVYGRRPIAA